MLYAASKSTDSVMRSINFSITSIQKHVNSMRSPWNSTAIKRMLKQLKLNPFSFSSGLGMRLVHIKMFDSKESIVLFLVYYCKCIQASTHSCGCNCPQF